MIRVQIMYLITDTVYHDEVVAERVNARLFDGGRAYVKTGAQTGLYAAVARIVIDHGFDGAAHQLIQSDVATHESEAGVA